MTKTSYDPDRFEALALRLFAVASDLKAIGRAVHEESLSEFQLHDRKPLEWLGKLEAWTENARRKLKDEMLREVGARKAREILAREKSRRNNKQSRKRSDMS